MQQMTTMHQMIFAAIVSLISLSGIIISIATDGQGYYG